MIRRRQAFTLIELILALGLAVVLISLISTTVFIYARAVNAGRWEIAEAQLARNVLRRMADDLRSAVYPQDLPNYKTAKEIVQSAMGTTPTSGAAPTPAANAPAAQSDSSSDSGDPAMPSLSEDEDENAPVEMGSAQPSGLYGTQYRLEVDVNRIPRLDEYQGLTNPSASPDVVSDVKRIAYFMRDSAYSSGAGARAASAGGESQQGLVRRKLDRAVSVWAAQNGDMGAQDQLAEVLAPEVTAVEFRYFDGAQWLTEWDSQALGGLPLMVEVALTIPRQDAGQTDTGLLGSSDQQAHIYRMLVHLPLARLDGSQTGAPISDAPAEEDAASEDSSSSASGSGASSP